MGNNKQPKRKSRSRGKGKGKSKTKTKTKVDRSVQVCDARGFRLKPYQKEPIYLLKSGQKKFLINFPTGTGKTITAINAAEWLRRHHHVKNIYVIAPKSLVTNFRKGFRVCYNKNKVPSAYKLFTYDKFARSPPSIPSEGSLVIVDEAHNLRNRKAKRSHIIADVAKNAEYVILLTATPFINSPADIANLLYMLQDADAPNEIPLDPNTFLARFVENPHGARNYKEMVRNKIITYKPRHSTKPQVTTHTIGVMLAPQQVDTIRRIQSRDLSQRDVQNLEALFHSNNATDINVQGKNMARYNAFLTRVRQASNVLTNIDELKKLTPGSRRTPLYERCSPKMERLVYTVVRGPKPAIIYSAFRGTGVEMVKRCLIKAGVPPDQVYIFTGHLTAKKRQEIVDKYNHGQIKYLLITKAGSEGISLRGTRQIHVLEPDWNVENIQQVIGRGVRINSHTFLPPKERKVDVYYWLGIVPWEDEMNIITPDPYIYKIAMRKQDLNKKFQMYNQEASYHHSE